MNLSKPRPSFLGAAGVGSKRTLKDQLMDLRKHCRGKTSQKGPHKGGEILWQLKDYKTFELLVLPTRCKLVGWELN
jgi:hypothetical protein